MVLYNDDVYDLNALFLLYAVLDTMSFIWNMIHVVADVVFTFSFFVLFCRNP